MPYRLDRESVQPAATFDRPWIIVALTDSRDRSAIIDNRPARYLQLLLATSSNVPIVPTLSFVSVFTVERRARRCWL